MRVVETSHLARSQTQPDARRAVRRVRACVLPHEGVYRARAAIGLKESDNALPAQGGDDRLMRPYGAKFVTYSSAVAGVTAAMTSAAQAMEVERSSWTIELVSFQFRPIRGIGLLQCTI
jgi:hypothetical protein